MARVPSITLNVVGFPARREKKLLNTLLKSIVLTDGTDTPLEKTFVVGVSLEQRHSVSDSEVSSSPT